MKLYHATNTGSVKVILKEGLSGPGGDPVHLSEDDRSEFIWYLFGLQPHGMFEFEHGYQDTVTLLEVDVTGLELDGPQAEAFGPDNDEHHMYFGVIPPERITVLRKYGSGCQYCND